MIPPEIHVEIIKWLPLKSLFRFRTVSKTWKSLIDSPRFIADYGGHHSHLLVSYYDVDFHPQFVSIVDDNTFPHNIVSPTLPHLVTLFHYYRIIGSSHGLLCFYCHYLCSKPRQYHELSDVVRPGTDVAVVWNMSIKKSVVVVVPKIRGRVYAIGFGVCRETTDPKIVMITYLDDNETDMASVTCQVDVFTLSTGAWRRSYSTRHCKPVHIQFRAEVVDGILYWLAIDRITMDGGTRWRYNVIISFDMTSGELGEVTLSDCLAYNDCDFFMYKLRKSLVVLQRGLEANNPGYDVWMMGGGVSKSFTKLFTINIPKEYALVRGFRKSGEAIIGIPEPGYEQLSLYESYSKHIENIGIDGAGFSFNVFPYTETLLLYDQPDGTLYNNV